MDETTKARLAGEIEFLAFSTGDLDGISRLITAMSSDDAGLQLRDKSPAYYRWMYFDNPAGEAFGCYARHGDRIVSSFAMAPKVMVVGGHIRRIGKTMDMFTDPDYQGMGLIKKCADRVFAEAHSHGVAGWYVTPSVNSYPIFKGKWGYQEPFQLIFRARLLDPRAVLAAVSPGIAHRLGPAVMNRLSRWPRRRLALPRGWVASELTRFGAETDALWDAVSSGHQLAIVRDATYLNWRYVDNPDHYTIWMLQHQGAIRGIVVGKQTVRRGLPVGDIVDLVCAKDDAATLRLLVRWAGDHFGAAGCALVESWSVDGTWFDRQLRSAGLLIARTKVPLLLSPDYPDPLLYDPDAWWLTQGDGNDV